MPKLLDAKTSGDLVRLLIFTVTTALATGLLVATIGGLSFGPTNEYKAEFSDATGVVTGDEVRIAGVKVGTVQDIETNDEGTRAIVTFSVDDGTRIDEATNAAIRYRNLLGQRYISLFQCEQDSSDECEGSGGEELDEGATIDIKKTSPALDLTVLFNGFKPLFEALSPDDINKLSFELVQVFQGEGGTLESLLGSTASLTKTLASRDQVIGDLLENLDYVLDHVADRDDQLTELIGSFRNLVGGLKEDREAILSSLDSISAVSVETASLVEDIRPTFVRDIKQLRIVAGNLDRNRAEIDRALQVLPVKLTKIGRTATYGAWFNFYLCHFKGTVRIGKNIIAQPTYATGAARCELG